jgi:tRNA threonylcarbamoyladenosine biosynthesis protein TsaE
MGILERLRRGASTGTAEETRALGAELAAVLPADTTLALHGDLGVGKTTFVQGLARGFGITAPVTSPTYTIYHLLRPAPRAGQAGTLLVHLDAYRIDSPEQFETVLLEDFLASPYCLAIEWPEHISNWLPASTWHLDLAIASGQRHSIRLR